MKWLDRYYYKIKWLDRAYYRMKCSDRLIKRLRSPRTGLREFFLIFLLSIRMIWWLMWMDTRRIWTLITNKINCLPLTWTGFCAQNFAMGKGDEEVITTLQKFARTVEEVSRLCHHWPCCRVNAFACMQMLFIYVCCMHACLLRILLAARGSGPHVDSKSTGSVNTEDLKLLYQYNQWPI